VPERASDPIHGDPFCQQKRAGVPTLQSRCSEEDVFSLASEPHSLDRVGSATSQHSSGAAKWRLRFIARVRKQARAVQNGGEFALLLECRGAPGTETFPARRNGLKPPKSLHFGIAPNSAS
jgi:hypothetical protein